MKSIHLLALMLLLPAALSACSESMLDSSAAAPEFAMEANGEALLFVGTEPTTLSTDLYLVRAASMQSENPSIAVADTYELERLTDLGGVGHEGLLVADGDRLFSDSLPYPIPDELGNRVALLASDSSLPAEEAPGRVAVLDMATRSVAVSSDVTGLQGVRFTAAGDWLILEQLIAAGQQRLLLLPADDLETDLLEVAIPGPQLSQEFAGIITDSNDFLVLAREEDAGTSGVYRVDAQTGAATLLTGQLEGLLTEPTLNRDGTLLAVTLTDISADKRSVVVIDDNGSPNMITDILDADCYWPAWSPTVNAKHDSQLTFVCQNITSDRPDIGLWSSNALDSEVSSDTGGEGTELDQDGAADLITNVSQPGIFEGTMDDLVIRSRPQWDPLGESLVFGVSTVAEAYAGEGMTLLVLPIGGTAYPIYSGIGTSVDWAHFSAAASEPSLLLWERSATGLEDTDSSASNAQPIRVIDIGQADPEPTNVRIGVDLLVSYPMFLGHNSMFYP